MKIFHDYGDVWNVKTPLYIVVNEKFSGDKQVLPFSTFNVEMTKTENPRDFFSFSDDALLYLAFVNPKIRPQIPNRTYIFKKNKLYNFGRTWFDELNNEISDYLDIWYEPFLFVHEKDYDQAIRYLKLNKVKKILNTI